MANGSFNDYVNVCVSQRNNDPPTPKPHELWCEEVVVSWRFIISFLSFYGDKDFAYEAQDAKQQAVHGSDVNV